MRTIGAFILLLLSLHAFAGEPPSKTDVSIKVLRDKSSMGRLAAIKELEAVGVKNDDALSALCTAIQDSDRDVARAAIEALGRLGKPGLKRLGNGFYNPPDVKIALVDALEKLGETLPEAVAYLARLAADSRSGVNKQAETALEQLGVPQRLVVSRLVDLLEKSDDEDVLYQTCVALGHLKATEAVDSLVKRLINDPNERTRQMAAYALGEIGVSAGAAVPVLRDALKSPHENLRYAAANSLGSMGDAARPAVPELIKALKDPGNSNIRNLAAAALYHLTGPEHAEFVPQLTDALEQENTSGFAVEALRRIGPNAPGVLEAMSKALAKPKLTLSAVSALRKFGRDAENAIPALLVALKHSNPHVRQAVAELLGRIGKSSDPVVAALIEATADKIPEVHKSAVQALKHLGVDTRVVVRQLLAIVQTPESTRRIEATAALRNCDPKAVEALSILQELITDETLPVALRIEAARSAVAIAPEEERTCDFLQSAMKDKDPSIRCAIAESMGEMKTKRENIVEILVAVALHDEVVSVQASATRGLAALKPESAKLLPLLDAGLRHEKPQARAASAKLLSRFIREPTYIDKAIQLLGDMKADTDLPVRDAVENALKVLRALR